MRIASRPLFALALGAALAVALAGAAIGQDATPAAAAGGEKDVVVKLKYDPQTPTKVIGIETPTPDPVELSKSKGEKAHWKLDPAAAGTIEIHMKGLFSSKPFKKDPASKGAEAVSDAPTEGTVGKSYGYTIKVKLADGTKLKLDPIIIITP
jgi:hypothetical protein